MTSPVKTRFQEALSDVSQVFDDPRSILAADDLTREQKIALLKQWETDLRLLLVASEENMTGDAAPGATAELLQECRRALAKLGATDGGGGAPTKQGGA